MTQPRSAPATLPHLDDATRELVRLAAVLAGGSEEAVRQHLAAAVDRMPHVWVEELLLQTYLFAGFPRALNGMRQWRRLGPPAPSEPEREPQRDPRPAGEDTCRRVYGGMYEKLRVNIRALHPLLDEWMIVEGYGKVLSRTGLDLPRRELCIVAACAASGQDRQLQSHLHGARNTGVSDAAIGAALDALAGIIGPDWHDRAVHMWNRLRNDLH